MQKRLKTKPTLILLGILLLGNLFWFVIRLLPLREKEGSDEQVAAVDGEVITRQQWLAAMESRYGKETLQNLVNEAVMEKAAEQYKISIKDKEIDLEIALMRSAQDANDSALQNLSNTELHQKVRAQLILEKVLTNDVVVEDEQAQSNYEENKSLYNIINNNLTIEISYSNKKQTEDNNSESNENNELSNNSQNINPNNNQ